MAGVLVANVIMMLSAAARVLLLDHFQGNPQMKILTLMCK